MSTDNCLHAFLLLFGQSQYIKCQVNTENTRIRLFSFFLFFLTFIYLFYFGEFFKLIYLFYFTILYWFCHTSTCICHECTCVPHPEPPSHLPPHTIPLGHPIAPAPSFLYPASNLDWRFISHMILYMFQCYFPKSPHTLPLPQSP